MRRNPTSLSHVKDSGPTSFCRVGLARAHTHTHVDACEVLAVNQSSEYWRVDADTCNFNRQFSISSP